MPVFRGFWVRMGLASLILVLGAAIMPGDASAGGGNKKPWLKRVKVCLVTPRHPDGKTLRVPRLVAKKLKRVFRDKLTFGACEQTPDCDDQNLCTTDSFDEATGQCVNEPIVCEDDGDVCTEEACDPDVGCQPMNSNEQCDDGNACTLNDFCQESTEGEIFCAGVIQPGCCNVDADCPPSEVDPLCTIVTCDPMTHTCAYSPKAVDPNACTVAMCEPTTGDVTNMDRDCDDSNSCTTDDCDVLLGCINDFDDTLSCDDGDSCTNDNCALEDIDGDGDLDPICSSTPVSCDDGNVCTTDVCDSNQGGCFNQEIDCEVGETCVPVSDEPVCSRDDDSDGVPNVLDNCPDDPNPGQEDTDADGVGDACDNCPDDPNPGQEDTDADGVADACDNCPDDPNPGQEDTDADGVGVACDNCPDDPNPGQEDADADGVGDACELTCPCWDGRQDQTTFAGQTLAEAWQSVALTECNADTCEAGTLDGEPFAEARCRDNADFVVLASASPGNQSCFITINGINVIELEIEDLPEAQYASCVEDLVDFTQVASGFNNQCGLPTATSETGTRCFDEVDNDGDGQVDCEDVGCDAFCPTSPCPCWDGTQDQSFFAGQSLENIWQLVWTWEFSSCQFEDGCSTTEQNGEPRVEALCQGPGPDTNSPNNSPILRTSVEKSSDPADNFRCDLDLERRGETVIPGGSLSVTNLSRRQFRGCVNDMIQLTGVTQGTTGDCGLPPPATCPCWGGRQDQTTFSGQTLAEAWQSAAMVSCNAADRCEAGTLNGEPFANAWCVPGDSDESQLQVIASPGNQSCYIDVVGGANVARVSIEDLTEAQYAICVDDVVDFTQVASGVNDQCGLPTQ